jgi:hypothetical protein
MALILFLTVSSIGLFTTRILLRSVMKVETFTSQRHALTLAFGFGLTWLFSFLAPVAYAMDFKLNVELFLFIFLTSIMVWILTYIIDLLLLSYRNK